MTGLTNKKKETNLNFYYHSMNDRINNKSQADRLDSPASTPYLKNRRETFNAIRSIFQNEALLCSQYNIVLQADSLAMLKKIPDETISLILTDPPYHVTKKQNIYGDRLFEEDEHYLKWMEQYIREWRRILKPNGSLFCFCDSSMSAKLESLLSKQYNVLSHIVWTKPNEPGYDGWKGKMKKEALRQWYPHSERILFAEPAVDENIFRSPLAHFLKTTRKLSGLTMKELTEKIGAYGKINHGGAVSNWEDGRNTPSKEQYQKLKKALEETQKVAALPAYEDVVRPFIMDKTREFTDVWTFPSVKNYKGKHPAEKPLSLLKHAIDATTFPGDIVLDCFAGSGNTALAAFQLNRRCISIDIEERWCDSLVSRLIEMSQINGHASIAHGTSDEHAISLKKPPVSQLTLSL